MKHYRDKKLKRKAEQAFLNLEMITRIKLKRGKNSAIEEDLYQYNKFPHRLDGATGRSFSDMMGDVLYKNFFGKWREKFVWEYCLFNNILGLYSNVEKDDNADGIIELYFCDKMNNEITTTFFINKKEFYNCYPDIEDFHKLFYKADCNKINKDTFNSQWIGIDMFSKMNNEIKKYEFLKKYPKKFHKDNIDMVYRNIVSDVFSKHERKNGQVYTKYEMCKHIEKILFKTN